MGKPFLEIASLPLLSKPVGPGPYRACRPSGGRAPLRRRSRPPVQTAQGDRPGEQETKRPEKRLRDRLRQELTGLDEGEKWAEEHLAHLVQKEQPQRDGEEQNDRHEYQQGFRPGTHRTPRHALAMAVRAATASRSSSSPVGLAP